MPRITNPRCTLTLSLTSTIAFFDHVRAKGKSCKILYEKADKTRHVYTIMNAPRDEIVKITLHAQIGRGKPPSPRTDLRTAWVSGKGWRSFKAAQIVQINCGTVVNNGAYDHVA